MINIKLLSLAIMPILLGLWLGVFIARNCTDTKFILDITANIQILGAISIATIVLVIFAGIFMILNGNSTERVMLSAIISFMFASGILFASANINSSTAIAAAASLLLIFLGLYNYDSQLGSSYRNLIKAPEKMSSNMIRINIIMMFM